MAASEFHYSKPQTTNSEKDWLNNHGEKAEIVTWRQPFSTCYEKPWFRPAQYSELEVVIFR